MARGKVALPLILRSLALAVLLGRLLSIPHPIRVDDWWVLGTALAAYLATYAWDYIAFLESGPAPNPHDVSLFEEIQALMPPAQLFPYFGYLACVRNKFVYKDIEGLHRYVDDWRFGNKEFVDKPIERARKNFFARASDAIARINRYTTLRAKHGPDEFARIDDQSIDSTPWRLYDEYQLVEKSSTAFLHSYENLIRLGKRRLIASGASGASGAQALPGSLASSVS